MNNHRRRWIPRLLGKLALVFTVLLCAGVALEIVFRNMASRVFPDIKALSDRSPAYVFPEDTREHPWARSAPEPLCVAVIGDSFTQGAGVQPGDAYGARLERLLNMNDQVRPARVRVFAKCGSSTFMQFGLLREALEWRPQVVLLGICLNDTEDWTNPAEIAAWWKDLLPRDPGRRMQCLTQRSLLLAWVYRQADRIRCRRGFLRYYRRLYSPQYKGWRQFAGALEQFRNDCANEGAAFGVTIFPLLSEKCEKNHYPFEYVHEAIRAQLDALQIPCLDLLETYRGKQPVRMQARPGVDPHPSEIAHRMAAEELMLWLMDRNFIAREYSPRRITGNERMNLQRAVEPRMNSNIH